MGRCDAALVRYAVLTDRANYEAEMGRTAAAESDYARALKMKPDPSIYLIAHVTVQPAT
jgi:hypothetical protein